MNRVGSLLFAALTFLLAAGCKKSEIVLVSTGVVLRQEQSAESKALATLPFGAEVAVVREGEKTDAFFGRLGRWKVVKYQSKTGWVFSPFLAPKASAAKLVVWKGLAMDEGTLHEARQIPKTLAQRSGPLSVAVECPLLTTSQPRSDNPHCGTLLINANRSQATLSLQGFYNAHDTWKVEGTAAILPEAVVFQATCSSLVNRYDCEMGLSNEEANKNCSGKAMRPCQVVLTYLSSECRHQGSAPNKDSAHTYHAEVLSTFFPR